jgi:hypothetical protein
MTTTMITTSSGANGITFLPTPLTQQQQQQLFGTPAIPGIQVVPAAHPSRVEAFLNRQSMGLGITLVISGTLAIIFNIVGLVVSDSLAVVGHGFYCGVMVSEHLTVNRSGERMWWCKMITDNIRLSVKK